MQGFLKLLEQLDLDLSAIEIADALWLANQINPITPINPVQAEGIEVIEEFPFLEMDSFLPEFPDELTEPEIEKVAEESVNSAVSSSEPIAKVSVPDPKPEVQQRDDIPQERSSSAPGVPFKAPTAPALRQPLELSRSLRPLMRRVPSRTEMVLDEEETAIRMAEGRSGAVRMPWTPVFRPALERWLDVELVVDEGRSMVIWEEVISEFRELLERQGAFRSVRVWTVRWSTTDLRSSGQKGLEMVSGRSKGLQGQRSRSPKELMDASGRRLILVMSDGMGELWQRAVMPKQIQEWSLHNPVALVQLLPERLWGRSAVGLGSLAWVMGLAPGVANSRLEVSGLPVWEEVDLVKAVTLPVVTLEPGSMLQWTKMVSGMGSVLAAGVVFDLEFVAAQVGRKQRMIERQNLSEALTVEEAEELLQRFRVTASPLARRLAVLMSVVPVSLPVVYLIQESVLPASRQVHLAEILMGGLLRVVSGENEEVRYDFDPQVRSLLQASMRKTETRRVLEKVSEYVADRTGLGTKDFKAVLKLRSDAGDELREFAEISRAVLRRLGGEYAAFVDELDEGPKLQTFEFDVAEFVEAKEGRRQSEWERFPHVFQVATIEVIPPRRRFWQRSQPEPEPEILIKKAAKQDWQYIEHLESELTLDLVKIPAGSFRMGAPRNEAESFNSERPQHQVTVPEFYMGKYPVTQAQWRFVARLQQVDRSLDLEPSNFKGDDRPVEQVSWLDTIEFCARLSNYTKREYRLPSEAEWEYACRAGTTTPFHFGETIDAEVANYQAQDETFGDKTYPGKYGRGRFGEYRKETTSVNMFQIANNFGLYDMHGNVWEWCQDHWHDNYTGAPEDGSAWCDREASENARRLLRGGSWIYNPRNCRSACRIRLNADYRSYNIGFRVVFSARILP